MFAALQLLNQEGLEGLNLRRLAAELGVRAPSLYGHFTDKNALLAAMMETIFERCIDSVPDQPDGRTWMLQFGKALWRTQHEVRDFVRLITTADADESQMRRTTMRIRARLQKLEMDETAAVSLQSALQALVTGWAAFAQAPYSAVLQQGINLDELVGKSMVALVDGWLGCQIQSDGTAPSPLPAAKAPLPHP